MALACSALTYIHANKQECIEHSLISGLTTGDNHTQYALLAGRTGTANDLIIRTDSGDGTIYGGTEAAGRLSLRGSTSVDRGSVVVGGVLTTASANRAAFQVSPLYDGAGDGAQGAFFAPIFRPSVNNTVAYAFLNIATGGPPTGVTLDSLIAGFNRVDTEDAAGAITAAYGQFISTPTLGALKPGTIIGQIIQNQGSSGVGTALGLWVQAQSGATANTAVRIDGNIDISNISAGAPNFTATFTSDTPTTTWTAGVPSNDPAGYIEWVIAGTPYYQPLWV